MTPDAVLSRFERLRETGLGRYLAPCPAHKDRSPSLSIRVTDDQRILLHCFAGCCVEDVVAAIGLTMGDLFPERLRHQPSSTFKPPRLRPQEALMLLGHEISVVAILLGEVLEILKSGDTPSDIALARMGKAFSRIQSVRNFTEEGTPHELSQIRRGAA
jgi:hypothetical protein